MLLLRKPRVKDRGCSVQQQLEETDKEINKLTEGCGDNSLTTLTVHSSSSERRTIRLRAGPGWNHLNLGARVTAKPM
ncbi:hypothetical protein QYF36_008684 [Acer negundo]|nr:hypothetical protein QYF36_008684 [Acer negundo]